MLENNTTRVLIKSTANPDCFDISTRIEGVKKMTSYDVISDEIYSEQKKYNVLN